MTTYARDEGADLRDEAQGLPLHLAKHPAEHDQAEALEGKSAEHHQHDLLMAHEPTSFMQASSFMPASSARRWPLSTVSRAGAVSGRHRPSPRVSWCGPPGGGGGGRSSPAFRPGACRPQEVLQLALLARRHGAAGRRPGADVVDDARDVGVPLEAVRRVEYPYSGILEVGGTQAPRSVPTSTSTSKGPRCRPGGTGSTRMSSDPTPQAGGTGFSVTPPAARK